MNSNPLSEASRDHLVALSLLPFMTPARARLLRERYNSFPRLLPVPATELTALLKINDQEAQLVRDPLQVPEIRRGVEAVRDRSIVIGDAGYPLLLRETADPPLRLAVIGDRSLLQEPAIALVGSRRASAYALNVARSLARELAAAKVVVISGLAAGVDAEAHRACLEANGKTIAVLGTGIDVVYPRSHQRLQKEIAESGLLVSELVDGTPPRPGNFPVRNRIIAGLSLGVVIVEATGRSGSLITARLAAEQNREVFAVPGPIFARGSEGPHRLIQYGAKLVHDVDDIFEEIRELADRRKAPARAEERTGVLAMLSAVDPLHVDQLAEVTGTSASDLASQLLDLELAGKVRALPGARYVRLD